PELSKEQERVPGKVNERVAMFCSRHCKPVDDCTHHRELATLGVCDVLHCGIMSVALPLSHEGERVALQPIQDVNCLDVRIGHPLVLQNGSDVHHDLVLTRNTMSHILE